MSLVYPPESPRHQVASLLMAYRHMTVAALAEKCKLSATPCSPAEIKAALVGLRRAGLAEHKITDKRWKLTESGRKHWATQHGPAAMAGKTALTQQPVAEERPKGLQPIQHSPELLTRGISRLSSPADRLPMVFRPGSLDSANLPRISGPYRVWPDGRRERIDGRAA